MLRTRGTDAAQPAGAVPSGDLEGGRVGANEALVLGLATLSQITVASASLGLAPLAGLIQADLGVSRSELGLLLSGSPLGAALVSLPSGWLTDLLGVRRTLILGLVVTGALYALIGFASDLSQALLLVFLAGLGVGFISPATTKAIMYWFPMRTRGTAMGIKQTGYPLGGALAAAVLPTVALAFGGWRAAIMATGFVAICVGGLCLWLYREHPLQKARDSDRSALGLRPLQRLLRDRRFLGVAGFGLCAGLTQSALMGYLSLFLQEVLLLSVVVAGGYLSLTQVGGGLGRVGWGFVSDRFFGGRRRPVLLIVGALAAGMALVMSTLGADSSGPALGAIVLLFGLVAIGWSGVFHTFVGEIAGRELAGTAIGLGLLITYVGVISGPPVFGFLVDSLGSYSLAWAILAAFALAGLALVAGLTGQAGSEPPAT